MKFTVFLWPKNRRVRICLENLFGYLDLNTNVKNMSLNAVTQRIHANWKSGITVSLVSIPLSVSLAIASQSTPLAGIITAIWAGLIASLFGGSKFNITGPTGALSGILATYAIIHGADALATLAIVAGFMILLSYLLRFEKFLVFVPASTIQGFTLGVAFIIAFNQFNFAFGLHDLPKHEKFIENIIESIKHLYQAQLASALTFTIFLSALILLLKVFNKIPAIILLAPVGILLGYLSQSGIIAFYLETLGTRYGGINPQLFVVPTLFFDYSLITAGVTVSIVAILETMISAKIADGMTKTKHNSRKEILALGLANIASGFAGGIPATAALARTATNIKSGANSKSSATISSIFVAVISLFFLSFFKYIPMAVIAAILVSVAIRMIERKHLALLLKHDRKGFVVCMLVALITIIEDPIVGIFFGTAVSLIIFAEKISKGQFELVLGHAKKGIVEQLSGDSLKEINKKHDVLVYSIKGILSYINGQSHVVRFHKNLNGYKQVIIRMRDVYYIDLDGVEALEEIIETIQAQGKQVLISSLNPLVKIQLEQTSKIFKDLEKNNFVFNKTTLAARSLGYKV